MIVRCLTKRSATLVNVFTLGQKGRERILGWIECREHSDEVLLKHRNDLLRLGRLQIAMVITHPITSNSQERTTC